MLTLYGISNCDTVRKARKWLTDRNIEFTFHDFRKDGLEKTSLESWCNSVSWEVLLNKRSTSWRNVPSEIKENLDQSKAVELMLDQPTLIKRPVLVQNDSVTVGFNDQLYSQYFSQ